MELNLEYQKQENIGETPKNLEFTLDEIFEKIGFKKYQYLVTILIIIASYSSVCFVFLFPYLLEPLNFQCSYENKQNFYENTEYCENIDKFALQKCEPVNEKYGFLTDFDLFCSEFTQRMFFVGFFIGNLIGGGIFNYCGDLYGRLKITTIGTIGLIVSLLLFVIYTNFYYNILLSCFIGFFTMGSSPAMSFTYESANSRWIPFFSTAWQVAFPICQILIAFIMFLRINWRFAFILAAFINGIYFAIRPFLKESPKFFESKGNSLKAHEIIKYIANFNAIQLEENFKLKSNETSNKFEQKQNTYKLLWSDKLLFKKTCYIIILSFIMGLIYYGITSKIAFLSGNIYINGILNGVSEALSCGIIGYFSTKFSSKIYLTGSFLLAALGCFCQGNLKNTLLECIMMYIGKFGISATFIVLYTFIGEAFPTAVSSTTVGISFVTMTISNICGALTPSNKGIFVIFGFICILAIIPSLTLPTERILQNSQENDAREIPNMNMQSITNSVQISEIQTKIFCKMIGKIEFNTKHFDHFSEFIQNHINSNNEISLKRISLIWRNEFLRGIICEYQISIVGSGLTIHKLEALPTTKNPDDTITTLELQDKNDYISEISGKYKEGFRKIYIKVNNGNSIEKGENCEGEFFEIKFDNAENKFLGFAGGFNGKFHYLKFYYIIK